LQIRAGRIFHFELRPAADEAFAGVIDKATRGQDAEFGEDLEAIADAESVAAAGVVVLDGVAEFRLRDQLREPAGHDVIAVTEAAGKCHELGFFDIRYGGVGDGDDGGGKAHKLQGTGGFGIAVGAWEFKQSGVRHD